MLAFERHGLLQGNVLQFNTGDHQRIGRSGRAWPLAIMANGPIAFFAVTDLYIVAGVVFDVASRGRVHPAYLWGGLLIVGSQIARLAVSHTAGWIAFARMLAT